MDTALTLRISFDKGEKLTQNEISRLLESSILVNKLTSDFTPKPLFAIWRVIALSEIPYSNQLSHTKEVIEYINKYLSTAGGFTLTGKETDLLPCYNAMLVEAYSKLGYADTDQVKNAVTWIKKYQVFDRETTTDWDGKGILKYGGCMKKTPCYIGIAKTVKALLFYSKAIDNADEEVNVLIEKGTQYLLKHDLYKRLSNKEPINKHILNLSFPASYQLNIVELLEIAYFTNTILDEACKDSIKYIESKKLKEGGWKINYAYKADGYLTFDQKGVKGEWVSYLLNRYLNKL